MNRKIYNLKAVLLLAILYSINEYCHAQVLAYQSADQIKDVSQVKTLKDVLIDLKNYYKVDILFSDQMVNEVIVPQDKINLNNDLENNLESILQPIGLKFKKTKKETYLIVRSKKTAQVLPSAIKSKTSDVELVINNLNNKESLSLPADVTITGRVTDENDEALPGVNVVLKGTTIGTTTNVEGRYSINVPDGKGILVFSFVGYSVEEYTIENQVLINVNLLPDLQNLGEVVVIGYGTVKKRDLTGSVASVKGEELTKFPTTTVTEALQGKVPGADITRNNGYAGAGPTIRIRGNRSIANPDASNNPLYIVDGVQGVDASFINPNDIESIDVLKDASSTSIYGSRGANGVIIVTTKRGAADKPRFSFNSYGGVSEIAGYGEYMSGPEYVAFRREAYRASGNWNSPDDDSKIFNAPLLEAIQKQQYVDWPELLIHNGAQQNYQLGVSGGSDKTKVYFSGDYFNEKGILKNDEFKRYTGRLNIDQKINNWLKVGINTQLIYSDNDRRRDPFNVASKLAPLGSPYDEEGNLIFSPGHGNEVNPLADEQPDAWKQNRQIINGTLAAYIELNPIKDLTIRSTFSTTMSDTKQGLYSSRFTIDGKGATSKSEITSARNRFISWENIFTYNKQIKEHSITLTGVTSYLSSVDFSNFSGGNNQLLDNQYYYNLSGASKNMYMGSKYVQYNLVSFTGRINYSWKSKYLLTLTGRTDGSSKLGEDNKWAFFPSIAAGWRISDEGFMDNQNIISDLKLRASYGVSGNDVIAPYTTQNLLTQIQFSYDEQNPAIAYGFPTSIGNPELEWELTTTKDFGIDFGIIKNRITGSIDYYDALTSNLIFPYTLPLTTGFSTVSTNIGETRNRGIEVALTTNNISSKNFTWTTNLTFFKNKEAIVKLPNGNVLDNDYRKSLIKGQPAQIYYDYQKVGIWQLGEESEAEVYGALPGDVKLKDISGPDGVPDGKISAQYDRTIIGTTVPKWSGGLNNSFKYKGFDLNIYLFARVGQWASSDYYGKYRRNSASNNPKVDYWTPENPTNAFPSPHATRAFPTQQITPLVLFESSYVKLRNVTIGYTLPKSFTNKFKVENFRIYLSGKNLHSFSKFKDFDPESEGITDQPLSRLYVGGINITF